MADRARAPELAGHPGAVTLLLGVRRTLEEAATVLAVALVTTPVSPSKADDLVCRLRADAARLWLMAESVDGRPGAADAPAVRAAVAAAGWQLEGWVSALSVWEASRDWGGVRPYLRAATPAELLALCRAFNARVALGETS